MRYKSFHGALAVGITLLPLCTHAQAGEFKKGDLQLKTAQATQNFDLEDIPRASSIRYGGSGKSTLGLMYVASPVNGTFKPNVRFALTDLTGPGKFGNAAIESLVVELQLATPWSFNPSKNACAFNFSRLGPTGVAGSLTCTGSGVPFQELVFTASP
jgi:hypothetical protein